MLSLLNNFSFETKRTFETELNRGGKVWKNIREISDKLCEEYNLSVITKPEIGKGKSHFEWEQDNQGKSWKAILRTNIDKCVLRALSFDDFLEKMKQYGYEIKQGKYISFRAEGQERFTRGKTLGWYYDEEHIKSRIERCVKWRIEEEARKRHEAIQAENNPYIIDDYIGRAIDLNDEAVRGSAGLRHWAMLQNMKNTSKLLNQLAERNINSPEELEARTIAMYDTQLYLGEKINGIEKEIKDLNYKIRTLSDYFNYKDLYKQYKSSKNPDLFFREHEAEIRRHELAKKAIKGIVLPNGKVPNISDMQSKADELERQRMSYTEQYKIAKAEISVLNTLREQVKEFGIMDRNKSRTDNIT